MPIVYIHGVATRRETARYGANLEVLKLQLCAHLHHALGRATPQEVDFLEVYWGDQGASASWAGISRPPSPLTGQGAEDDRSTAERLQVAAELYDLLDDLPSRSAGPPGGPLAVAGPVSAPAELPSLAALRPSELLALLTTLIEALPAPSPEEQVARFDVAEAVANDPRTLDHLRQLAPAEQPNRLEQLLAASYNRRFPSALATQGGAPRWLRALTEQLDTLLHHAASTVGDPISKLVVELFRKRLHEQATLFLGDVFTYLASRGSQAHPGPIPMRLIDKLQVARDIQARHGGEPIILVSHSMGGQIAYDVLTYFLPAYDPQATIRVDFWCATASQVGFFEELKLLGAADPALNAARGSILPFPDRRRLGYWWNVWDNNDVLSFTTRGIFAQQPPGELSADAPGVDDEEFPTGQLVGGPAHGGYFRRTDFFERFREKAQAARAISWRRP